MKVSIIIPSFNQEQYLSDAIESAITQTFSCEIIVIDDGSTDNSLTIARSYEPRIKVISQVNKGLASARNTGIMNAIGEFILPLDADDILKEECVETLLMAMEKYQADIVAPSFKSFGVHNHELVLSNNVTLAHFRDANYLPYFSLIRKSKLLEVGGYSPKMVFGYEDYHMWINLLIRGAKLLVLKQILVMYRTKEQSMIHTAQEHHLELMAQIKKDFPQLYV